MRRSTCARIRQRRSSTELIGDARKGVPSRNVHGLMRGLTHRSLFSHGGLETFQINFDTSLGSDIRRDVERETVRVVQCKASFLLKPVLFFFAVSMSSASISSPRPSVFWKLNSSRSSSARIRAVFFAT